MTSKLHFLWTDKFCTHCLILIKKKIELEKQILNIDFFCFLFFQILKKDILL